jgi:hypothetical protein
MRFNVMSLAAAAFLAASAPAMASGLQPEMSQSINLGDVAGDAYYTVQPDGYHVVATFAQRGGAGTPVRFQAVLGSGQSVTFSSPRAAGEQPVSLSIKRQGEHVVVEQAALVD